MDDAAAGSRACPLILVIDIANHGSPPPRGRLVLRFRLLVIAFQPKMISLIYIGSVHPSNQALSHRVTPN
jgi:hypothetical protein